MPLFSGSYEGASFFELLRHDFPHLLPFQHLHHGQSTSFSSMWGAYVGKVIVVRIPPPHCFLGRSNVSSPVHGAPPKGSCFMLLKQR